MSHVYILHIETSTTVCSIALSNADKIISYKETNNGYTHAENLHVFINDILNDAKLKVIDLAAISISIGPGSYTGLRIGYSTAKGLCYALKIPLIEVSTLQALTQYVINTNNTDALYCPMLDARRMEVYTAVYDCNLNEIKHTQALVLNDETLVDFKTEQTIYFFGDGIDKAKDLLNQHFFNAQFIPNITASSKHLVQLAFQKFTNKQFTDCAYAEPMYLKEFFFTTTKK